MSNNNKRRETLAHHLQEKFRVAADDSLEQGVPVSGLFGDGLAKCKGVTAGIGLRQVKVMGRNGC